MSRLGQDGLSVNERWRVPPGKAGDRPEGDGWQVGHRPVQQHGCCHLRTISVADGQDGDQSEFGDTETAGVMGSTVRSRTNAKAAREVCQGTWRPGAMCCLALCHPAARAAGKMAMAAGWLIWNHGESGDAVQAAYPGHVVSLLTPGEPVRRTVHPRCRRWNGLGAVDRAGEGSFGRQVADGAQKIAEQTGVCTRRLSCDDARSCAQGPRALVSAGTFEDDVAIGQPLPAPARAAAAILSVAAGVYEFARKVDDPEGVFCALNPDYGSAS